MDAFRQDISTMSTALVFKREIPRWHLEICLGEFLIEFSVVGKIVPKNIFVLSFQHRSMGFTFNSYSNQDDFKVPRVAKMTGRKYGKFHFLAWVLWQQLGVEKDVVS